MGRIFTWLSDHFVVAASGIGLIPVLRFLYRRIREQLGSAWDDRVDNWTNRFIDFLGRRIGAPAVDYLAHSHLFIPLAACGGILAAAYLGLHPVSALVLALAAALVATGLLVLLLAVHQLIEASGIGRPRVYLDLTYHHALSSCIQDDASGSHRRVRIVNTHPTRTIDDVRVTIDAFTPQGAPFLPLPLTALHGTQPFTLHPGEPRFIEVVKYEDELGDYPDQFVLRYANPNPSTPQTIPVSKRPYSLVITAHGKDMPACTRRFGLDIARDRTLLFWPQQAEVEVMPVTLTGLRLPDLDNPRPQFTDDPQKRHLARLLRMANSAPSQAEPPAATETPPAPAEVDTGAGEEHSAVTAHWLMQTMVEQGGYSRHQLADDQPGDERQAGICLDSLRQQGITTRSAVRALLADSSTSRIVEQLFLDELPLTRTPRNVRDASGLCTWGPSIHTASSPDERARAIAKAREGIAGWRTSEERSDIPDPENYAQAITTLLRTIESARGAFWRLLEDRTDETLLRRAVASVTSINDWQQRAASKLPKDIAVLVRDKIAVTLRVCASQYREYARYSSGNDNRQHHAWDLAQKSWGQVWDPGGLADQLADTIRTHDQKAVQEPAPSVGQPTRVDTAALDEFDSACGLVRDRFQLARLRINAEAYGQCWEANKSLKELLLSKEARLDAETAATYRTLLDTSIEGMRQVEQFEFAMRSPRPGIERERAQRETEWCMLQWDAVQRTYHLAIARSRKLRSGGIDDTDPATPPTLRVQFPNGPCREAILTVMNGGGAAMVMAIARVLDAGIGTSQAAKGKYFVRWVESRSHALAIGGGRNGHLIIGVSEEARKSEASDLDPTGMFVLTLPGGDYQHERQWLWDPEKPTETFGIPLSDKQRKGLTLAIEFLSEPAAIPAQVRLRLDTQPHGDISIAQIASYREGSL